jgi:Tfp pilus assembly protein PilF
MYLRFDTITALDPYFLEAYQFGGKYLSIVKDDLEGSRLIFEKGITYYPDNYDLLFNYGFLLAFELNEFKLAHKIYKKVATFPQSPNFIKTLLNKVLFEANQDLNEIFSILSEIYEKEAEDSPLKSKLKHDLYAVRAQIDLECLNMHKQNCNTKDIDGVNYEFRDGKYTSVYKFTPYRLNKNR